MSVTKSEVLRLYKNLIQYSKALTLTDPAYFRKRVTSEFRKNKNLNKPDDITFAYQVCRIVILYMLVLYYSYNFKL